MRWRTSPQHNTSIICSIYCNVADCTLAEEEEEESLDILSELLAKIPASAKTDGAAKVRTSAHTSAHTSKTRGKEPKKRDREPEPSGDSLGSKFLQFLQQNSEITSAILSKLNVDEEPAEGKRPAKRVKSDEDEETSDLMTPSLWTLDEDRRVVDNSVDKLDWELRVKLRNPNGQPSSWWPGPELVDTRVTYPRRAHSMVLDHLSGTQRMNGDTIARYC